MDIKELKKFLNNIEKSKKNAEVIFYRLEGQEELLRQLIDIEEKEKIEKKNGKGEKK